jgi:hypothetical protein
MAFRELNSAGEPFAVAAVLYLDGGRGVTRYALPGSPRRSVVTFYRRPPEGIDANSLGRVKALFK